MTEKGSGNRVATRYAKASLGLATVVPLLVIVVAIIDSLARLAAHVALLIATLAFIFGAVAFTRDRRAGDQADARRRSFAGMGISAFEIALAAFYLFAILPVWHMIVCSQNLEYLPGVFQMYAADHGAFPPADSWCDALGEYVQNDACFVCSVRPNLKCGYAMNRALGGLCFEDIQTPSHRTVILFESDAGWNANGGPELLPPKSRHHGGDYYGFAGGVMNTDRPPMERIRREQVVDGTADIFWDPMGATEAGSPLPANE